MARLSGGAPGSAAPPEALVDQPSLLAPSLLDDPLVERAQRSQLELLCELIQQSGSAGATMQHVLLHGPAGMGKTLLLHRLAAALRDQRALARRWTPLLFDEQPRRVTRLADLWGAALEALAVSAGDDAALRRCDALIDDYPDPTAREEAARHALLSASEQSGRKLLLLVDDLAYVLDALDELEAARLRELLQHEDKLLLVGTTRAPLAASYDYASPFYELFRAIDLAPVSSAIVAMSAPTSDLLDTITGQSLRAALALRCSGNSAGSANNRPLPFGQALGKLIASHAPIYASLLERLPRQASQVFDGLARAWDPQTAEQLAERIGVDRAVASGQLHTLIKRGLVRRAAVPGRALGFIIVDRLFALWLLACSPRGRRELGHFCRVVEALGSGALTQAPRPERQALRAREAAAAYVDAHPNDTGRRLQLATLELDSGRVAAAEEQLGRALESAQGDLEPDELALLRTTLAFVRAGVAERAHRQLHPASLRPLARWPLLSDLLALSSGADPVRVERLAPEKAQLLRALQATADSPAP